MYPGTKLKMQTLAQDSLRAGHLLSYYMQGKKYLLNIDCVQGTMLSVGNRTVAENLLTVSHRL